MAQVEAPFISSVFRARNRSATGLDHGCLQAATRNPVAKVSVLWWGPRWLPSCREREVVAWVFSQFSRLARIRATELLGKEKTRARITNQANATFTILCQNKRLCF